MTEQISGPILALLHAIGVEGEAFEDTPVQGLYAAYTAHKGLVGGTVIAAAIGVEHSVLASFEADFRHLARRSERRAKGTESSQEARDRELATWVLGGWLEAFQAQGLALGLDVVPGSQELELKALRQVRAAEQLLRDLVRESAGSADALVEELRGLFGAGVVDDWSKRSGGGDVLDGTTFAEVGSLIASKERFRQYEKYFDHESTLQFLPDRRRALVRFLDEIRRARNALVHNQAVTSITLETVNRCFEEITSSVQECFDAGQSQVNPLSYLDASEDEVREWAAGMEESLAAVHDSLEGFRADVSGRLGALADGVDRAASAAETGSRRSRWILAGTLLLMVGVVAVWRGVAASGDSLEEIVDRSGRIEAGVEEIADGIEGVASLGGLIAKPQSRAEFIHNARLLVNGGRYSASNDAYQRALELGPRTLDIAREYVDSMVAVEGEEIALARALRWLDPTGAVYENSGGSIALIDSAVPDSNRSLAVEAALLPLIDSDQGVIEWASSLASLDGADPVRVAVLERYGRASPRSRTRAIMGLCKDMWAQLEGAGPRAVENCFFDQAEATRVREQVAGLAQSVEAMSEAYWSRKIFVAPEGWFGGFEVRVLIPDVEGQAVLEFGGKTYELVAGAASWREGRSLLGDGLFSPAELEAPCWSYVGSSPKFAYGEGGIDMAVSWTPFAGAEPQRFEFTVDSLAVCSRLWRHQIEGSPRIIEGKSVFAWHGPGAIALRSEYAGMSMVEAARAVDRAAWAEGWSERGAKGALPCHDPHLLCEVADPEAKGYSCGGHPVTVSTAPRLLPGSAQLDFSRLMANRRGLSSIRYSLGTPALDQELRFEKLDHRSNLDPRERYSGLLSASGGEPVTGAGMVIEDRFSGPLFLRWSYLDGTDSDVVKIDLVDPLAPPAGWPKKGLAELKAEADVAMAAAGGEESKPNAGAVSFDQVESVDGGTARWQSKAPGAFRPESTGPVRHGQMAWSSEDGMRNSTSVWADGVPVAYAEKDAAGRVVRFQLTAPLWEKPEDWYGPFDGWSQRPPSAFRAVGPSVGNATDGRDGEDGGAWFGVTRDWLSTAKPARQRPLEETELTGGLSFKEYLGDGHLLTLCDPMAFMKGLHALDGSGHPGIYASCNDRLQELDLLPPTFSAGQGLVIDGLPVGYWSELDDSGSIRAQGWVVPWGEDHPAKIPGKERGPLSKFVA
ncbi:STY4199 family HEPN domain-containing protein, partial [Planctomycetota bacterium]|nr:STY4199 family HEPN domain-containing protein [Planctomycetota bacterium]